MANLPACSGPKLAKALWPSGCTWRPASGFCAWGSLAGEWGRWSRSRACSLILSHAAAISLTAARHRRAALAARVVGKPGQGLMPLPSSWTGLSRRLWISLHGASLENSWVLFPPFHKGSVILELSQG